MTRIISAKLESRANDNIFLTYLTKLNKIKGFLSIVIFFDTSNFCYQVLTFSFFAITVSIGRMLKIKLNYNVYDVL